MAVTLRASGVSAAATTGTSVSASFTPTAGATLVAFFSAMDEGAGSIGGSFTITDSAGLTWTSRATASNAGGFFHQGRVWTSVVGGSPSSMTVTFGCAGTNHSQRQWFIVEVSNGAGVGTAAGAVTTTANGAYTLTLPTAPDASSVIVACVGMDATNTTITPTGAVNPGAGWTELGELYSNLTVGRETYGQAQHITGSTSTSVTWADLRNDDFVSSIWSTSALAVEITTSAPSSAATAPTGSVAGGTATAARTTSSTATGGTVAVGLGTATRSVSVNAASGCAVAVTATVVYQAAVAGGVGAAANVNGSLDIGAAPRAHTATVGAGSATTSRAGTTTGHAGTTGVVGSIPTVTAIVTASTAVSGTASGSASRESTSPGSSGSSALAASALGHAVDAPGGSSAAATAHLWTPATVSAAGGTAITATGTVVLTVHSAAPGGSGGTASTGDRSATWHTFETGSRTTSRGMDEFAAAGARIFEGR